MTILDEQTTTDERSRRVALAIAQLCPDALFCTFLPTPDGRKIPYNRRGQGVAAETPAENLYTAAEVKTASIPSGHLWGVVMHHPVRDPFGGLLTVLDVDMKRSDSTTDVRIQRLGKWAKEHGHLTERSYSGKGRHVILLADDEPELLASYRLGNHQEIEVFGQQSSAGKSVMLTGDEMSQAALGDATVRLTEVLHQLGIEDVQEQIDNKAQLVTPPTPVVSNYGRDDLQRAADALEYVTPDVDYNDWIMVGQALHDAFGDAGRDVWQGWSSAGSKYQGDKDIETHWRSFHAGKGVGLGSLYNLAKQGGWKPPTRASERRTAVEDFGLAIRAAQDVIQVNNAETQAEDGAPAPAAPHWPELTYDLSKPRGVDYLIDGYLAHSLSLIAGQPGVGKTTVMTSLALIASGHSLPDCSLKAPVKRKVIYVTEDTEQVVRSLYAHVKRHGLDIDQVKQSVVVIEAKRSQLPDLLKLAENVINHTIDGNRPWLILDTANATLDLENENDNSEVGAYISGLKQTLYVQLGVPISIIHHTNKQISRTDAEAMGRGASALTGDVTLTAVIFMDEDGNRYMRLAKRRYEPTFDELAFTSDTFTEPATTSYGDLQELTLRVVVPKPSSEDERKQAAAERRAMELDSAMSEKADLAVNYVTDLINQYGPLAIKMGSGGSNKPPQELSGLHRVNWADIISNVPGGDGKHEIRRAIKSAILDRMQVVADAGWGRIDVVNG
jgi:hypothetical protein